MDDNYRKLLSERDSLQARLRRVDTAIESYERWKEDVASLLGDDGGPDVETRSYRDQAQTPITDFEKAVRDLFRRTSAPLNRTDVHEELTNQGVIVGGKEPLNTVASRLSRMEGIINLKGHGYWAEDRPYPPAGYPKHPEAPGLLFDNSEADGTEGQPVSEHQDARVSNGDEARQQERDQDAS